MGQSLAQNYIHLVFGSKNRYPFIKPEIAPRLHAYIGGALKKLDSPALKINSCPDHLHILLRLTKNYSLSKVIEEIKKQSSIWVKGIDNANEKFFWQTGYGAFSVSSSQVEGLKEYIDRQEEHHKRMSFREGMEKFIMENDLVDYNPEYFWR